MSYQALYRKYRPRRFGEVVGQDHITTILRNQVHSGHFAHAYLFSGSRGTGKTSIAKIFARAVNCLSPEDGEPCGVCEACRHSLAEDAVDIIEMDAASNTGVDDMRALLEKARFTPLQLKYKVYIIDEVHMLSTSASNALLKTLEEPPAHVVFLLATTEPQKLLATVISRCQRFDFHRLSLTDIINTVKGILQSAKVHIDEGGLLAIARAADGGMRDALSLADQCLAFCGDTVSEQDVYDVLGCMQLDFLFDMAGALIGSDPAQALRLLDGVVRGGRDLGVFTQDLAQHIRALLLAKVCGDCTDLLDCTGETMARYQAQAALCSQERLLRTLDLLSRVQSEMKWQRQPRVLVESMLVRICRPEDEQSLLALEDRIERLEAALLNGMAQAPQPALQQTRPVQPIAMQPGPELSAQADALADSGQFSDAPPWDEPVPPPLYNEPEIPTQAPSKPATPAQTAPVKATDAKRVDPVWDAMYQALQKQNPSLYVLAKYMQSVTREGNVLTIAFPPVREANAAALNAPRNLEFLRNLLKSIDPGLQLRIIVQLPQAEDPQTQDMLRVFGDRLNIEK